jgi:hypothetical protein
MSTFPTRPPLVPPSSIWYLNDTMKPAVKKAVSILHEAFLTFVCICLFWCAKPITPPGSLLPMPDAAVSDVFTGLIADCSDLLVSDRTSKAQFWVQSCMDLESGADACMVKGTETFTKDALVCLLIDMNVQWQRDIADGVSNAQAMVNSATANRWLRNHQVGARR